MRYALCLLLATSCCQPGPGLGEVVLTNSEVVDFYTDLALELDVGSTKGPALKSFLEQTNDEQGLTDMLRVWTSIPGLTDFPVPWLERVIFRPVEQDGAWSPALDEEEDRARVLGFRSSIRKFLERYRFVYLHDERFGNRRRWSPWGLRGWSNQGDLPQAA